MNLYTKIRKKLFGKLRKKSRQNYYSNQSLPTTLETENGIISEKNVIAEEFNTFFTNMGPNLANKLPQISGTFNQYFSPVDT